MSGFCLQSINPGKTHQNLAAFCYLLIDHRLKFNLFFQGNQLLLVDYHHYFFKGKINYFLSFKSLLSKLLFNNKESMQALYHAIFMI